MTSRPLVLIDATAVPRDRRGVGRYVDGVIGALHGPIAIACQSRDEEHYRHLAPGATILPQHGIGSVWRRLLWEQISLPRIARRAGAAVIHSPHYTAPLLTRLPRVVTFHDATFFSDPGAHTGVKGVFFRGWTRCSARIARVVIVPSRATADELAHYVRRTAGYVVAHHGVDPAIFHPPTAQEIARARTSLGLGKRWIAFLGTVEPRKNVPALIEAYARLRPSASHPLLAIAGGSGWERDLETDIAAVPMPGRVLRLGYIDLDVMSGFLGGAELVVYPSSGEGFGLPVLEGMSCGAAVLTTRRLALPEVGGDAVEYTEPDAASINEALEELLHDATRRRELSALGLERAKAFTWAACAEVHLQVYTSVVRG